VEYDMAFSLLALRVKFITYFIFVSQFCFLGCNWEKNSDTLILHITNRSHSPIDSIVIPYKETKVKEKIEAGKTFTIKLDVSQFNSGHEGFIPVFLYQNKKSFSGQFGFHDWGVFAEKEEYIYLFDHGINYKDEELKKPIEMNLLLIPKTSLGIDSIEVALSVLKKKNINATYTELILDFELFEKEPEIKLYQKGTWYILKVDHNWDNWNNTQEIIYVYENGIFSKKNL